MVPAPVAVMAAVVVVEIQCMDYDDIEQAQSGGGILYARLRQWARSLHITFLEKGFTEEKG